MENFKEYNLPSEEGKDFENKEFEAQKQVVSERIKQKEMEIQKVIEKHLSQNEYGELIQETILETSKLGTPITRATIVVDILFRRMQNRTINASPHKDKKILPIQDILDLVEKMEINFSAYEINQVCQICCFPVREMLAHPEVQRAINFFKL